MRKSLRHLYHTGDGEKVSLLFSGNYCNGYNTLEDRPAHSPRGDWVISVDNLDFPVLCLLD